MHHRTPSLRRCRQNQQGSCVMLSRCGKSMPWQRHIHSTALNRQAALATDRQRASLSISQFCTISSWNAPRPACRKSLTNCITAAVYGCAQQRFVVLYACQASYGASNYAVRVAIASRGSQAIWLHGGPQAGGHLSVQHEPDRCRMGAGC